MSDEAVRVLLVEDNEDHAELVMRQLDEHHLPHRVTRLADGQAALDYLFRRGEFTDPARSPRPHLILLDLRLPRVDGLEVLKALKESDALRQIPVVILTTSDAQRDVVRAYDHHANSYVVKPVGFEKFQDLMKDLGGYWVGWNTHPPESAAAQ